MTTAENDGSHFAIHNLKEIGKRDANRKEIRRRVQAIFVGNNTVLCRMLGRYKFYVAADDVGFSSHLMMEGFWEIHITEFIARHVSTGMTVLDLGANFGYYTILMASLVGPQGNVHAIEPNPAAVALLRKNVAVNGFGRSRDAIVRIHERAIWDSTDHDVTLRIPPTEAKNAHVMRPSEAARPDQRDWVQVEVKTLALDDLPLENVSLIKADIEGAEERLWGGMQQFLKRNRDVLLLLEFNCHRCQNARETLSRMAEVFPLRYLERNGQVLEATPDEIIEGRPGDWMLVLTRRPI